MSDASIAVRGAATPEEIAAVLAVVASAGRPQSSDPYRQWRTGRLQALRRTAAEPDGVRR